MEKEINFNGFASEEQYEAVMEIIKNEIDDMCDTLQLEFDDSWGILTIYVDDYIVSLNYFDGVCSVQLSDNVMEKYQLIVIMALDKITSDIFKTIRKTDNAKFNFGI